MSSDFIKHIREYHVHSVDKMGETKPHQPKVLYIGCVDARLDPKRDIGFDDGSTIILRNIGGIVAGRHANGDPISVDQAGAIGFAVEMMNVEHIVVAAHTCCGGLRACLSCNPALPGDLKTYLSTLEDLRDEVFAQQPEPGEEQEKLMRELVVRRNLNNLVTYFPAVKKRVEANTLDLHGWILDTGTRDILEFDQETDTFESMLTIRAREKSKR